MLEMSKEKRARMAALSTDSGKIKALAIDQRGALKRMMAQISTQIGEQSTDLDQTAGKEPEELVASRIETFKQLVSEELTPYASAILLDPEYGLPAAKARDSQSGLLLAYEKTGYDATTPGRLPDLLSEWSVLRLKEMGADAIKFLLYYDVDEAVHINQLKQVFIERLGSECAEEDLPFYLELVSYDATISDSNSMEYAKAKPHKVIEMMKEFSKPVYKVDVLKVEVPVNMNFVEGFSTNQSVYTRNEAATYFLEQSQASDLPFIFLSAGVSAELFKETLLFAHESGSTFNGVLCGRATWSDGVKPFIELGEEATRDWLKNQGRENITSLNAVVEKTASPWYEKIVNTKE
ncbi:tagatose 1,6-diphosphate aldolase [Enterococcus sp. JM4C]|uniref:tagatose-bisphosphate aldolase n=1 Tax=Candidatus Enterococcus huntleyi TaxID=1857217 RepID=UPI00137B0CF4|nr:tagatose-bisphosphate aldolase [Enterococcus sp. JM4C]KAF1295678.1 tagatose 1,6-diphosphate aldolase [Enterococcus sp. JM4C]